MLNVINQTKIKNVMNDVVRETKNKAMNGLSGLKPGTVYRNAKNNLEYSPAIQSIKYKI